MWNVTVKYLSTVILHVNFLLKFSTAVWGSLLLSILLFPLKLLMPSIYCFRNHQSLDGWTVSLLFLILSSQSHYVPGSLDL